MGPDLVSLIREVRRAAEEAAGSAGDPQGSSGPALSVERVEASIPLELSTSGVRSATARGARQGRVARLTLVLTRVDAP